MNTTPTHRTFQASLSRPGARRAGLALALGAALAAPSTCAFAQQIGVQLNGAPVTFSEAAPLNAESEFQLEADEMR